MGDLTGAHACAAFTKAFEDDLVKRFRSEFLDLHFGERVEYYLNTDSTWWLVELIAAIKTGIVTDGKEQTAHFRVESAPIFAPMSDSIAYEVADALDIEEEDAEQRLKKAAE